jgi:HSP20 family molecular chaperone IbpA
MAEQTAPVPSGSKPNGGELTRDQERHVPTPVDIYETPEGLVLWADMPGVDKENLEVRIDNGVLTIAGRTNHSLPGDPVYQEFDLVPYFRQFELGDQVDTEKINAELKYGVLKLNLPRAEEHKPRKVEVKIS